MAGETDTANASQSSDILLSTSIALLGHQVHRNTSIARLPQKGQALSGVNAASRAGRFEIGGHL